MVVDAATTAINPLISGGGSAIVGYVIGFAILKILKWILIIAGVICGVIFIAIQWLKTNNYIDNVKWDRLGNDASSYVQHLASQLDLTNLHGVFSTLGIPVSSGVIGCPDWIF